MFEKKGNDARRMSTANQASNPSRAIFGARWVDANANRICAWLDDIPYDAEQVIEQHAEDALFSGQWL